VTDTPVLAEIEGNIAHLTLNDPPMNPILAIVAQPRTDERIFPYSMDGVCAAFHRATYTLGISRRQSAAGTKGDDHNLHFHDLLPISPSRNGAP
jgi:hypothetical protein